MNETKQVDPSFLDGKEPIAKGYKIFNWDWMGYNGAYCYADENGNVEGSVHTVTGKIKKCGWGLHFCENPVDCMRYRDLVQWSKFAEVEAFDEVIKADGDDKSVCRTLLIKKVLSFDEMIKACKSYQKEANIAEATNGIINSYGIRDGYGIRNGSGISDGSGIRDGYGIYNGSGIRDGYGIINSYGIRNGCGIYSSKHCRKCEGISRCLLCYDLEGAKLMLFNKPISEERFNEVYSELGSWYPNFTNAEELKSKYGNGEWKSTPAPAISGRTAKEAYAEMPDELREYIQSLPEYDEEIFKKITGEADER